MEELKLTLLGTGSPRPDLERSGPSQVLSIGETHILIDCGEGTTTQLMKAEIAPQKIEYLFMTHLHSDHLFGYGQFLLGGWGLGRRKLTVVGPKGMKHFHETLVDLFKEDIDYRTSLGRPGNGVEDVHIIEIEEPGFVKTDLPLDITAAEMVHNVKTYGFRFESGDHAVVISGDTAPTPNVVELSKDADILVMDACLAPTAVYRNTKSAELQEIWNSLQKEHCTPEQAAEAAKEAGVKILVMTHFLPNIDEKETYQKASDIFKGEVIVGRDLQVITVRDYSRTAAAQ